MPADSDVARTTTRALPSERSRQGDPRQVGFQPSPSSEHLERAGEALQNVARLVTSPATSGLQTLQVCFCHVRLAPRLPFNLYGFHVVEVDDSGGVVDSISEDSEIRYAVIVNQPVAVQTDAAVRFLFDLVGRQGPIADVAAGRKGISDLPTLVADADSAAAEVAWDTLRLSVKQAASTLHSRAEAAGYRLVVRYERDPLPTRASVMKRVPALRLLYNDQEQVRDAVDRTVTALATDRAEIHGGPEEIRAMLQRHTSLLGVRQFLNQTVRDADMLGNGFLEFGFIGLDPTLRCLRTEDVEIGERGAFAVVTSQGREDVRNHVMHLRGLEQLESSYGISPWEPLLYLVQRKAHGESIRQFIAASRAGRVSDTDAERLSELSRVLGVIETQVKKSLDTLLWFPRIGLPPPSSDLYFTGQERL